MALALARKGTARSRCERSHRLSPHLYIGFQIQIPDQPVQVLGVNSQEASGLDVTAIAFVQRCENELFFRLAQSVVVSRRGQSR